MKQYCILSIFEIKFVISDKNVPYIIKGQCLYDTSLSIHQPLKKVLDADEGIRKVTLYHTSRRLHEFFPLDYFNPFPNKPWFLRVCRTSVLKTLCEKEKLLVTSNFSFSHSVFYSFGKLSAIYVKFEIVVCNFFQFGRV